MIPSKEQFLGQKLIYQVQVGRQLAIALLLRQSPHSWASQEALSPWGFTRKRTETEAHNKLVSPSRETT